jgi:hypothetical protein
MIRCLALIAPLVVGQADADLKAEVQRLVRGLDAPQLAQREAAEAELLRRGPAVLDSLPPLSDRTSAEVRQRLDRVRRKLQQQAADAVAAASTITLHGQAMPLSKVLAALQEQSGNAIVDYRRRFGQPATDPMLHVDFQRTAFWPAIDSVLDQARLTLYPFSEQRALSIIAVSNEKRYSRTDRACYSGPFRFEPVAIIARRDLREADGRSLVLTIEIAWEPRLKIINLVQRMGDIHAVDERGETLPAADRDGQKEVPISGDVSAVKLDLPLRLPPRESQKVAQFRGKLLATIPGRIETFRFDKLAEAKNVEKRIAGATVTLEQVRKSGETWEVHLKVRFDEAGDALASHRQWIFSNEAYLEDTAGKPIAHDTFETTAQSKNEVGVTYLFSARRPLDGLTFVYKTPGTIISGSFEYELKNIRLP